MPGRIILDINDIIIQLNNLVWSWPLLLFIVSGILVVTLSLSFVQFRYFFKAWKLVFSPQKLKLRMPKRI